MTTSSGPNGVVRLDAYRLGFKNLPDEHARDWTEFKDYVPTYSYGYAQYCRGVRSDGNHPHADKETDRSTP